MSYGCGALFINWLRFQPGIRLAEIFRAGGSTRVETCRRLSGWTDPFVQFITVVNLRIPSAASTLLRDTGQPLYRSLDRTGARSTETDPDGSSRGQTATPDAPTSTRHTPDISSSATPSRRPALRPARSASPSKAAAHQKGDTH